MTDVLVITEDGYGKRIALADIPPRRRRGGPVVRLLSVPVAAAVTVDRADDVVIATAAGKVERIAVKDISTPAPTREVRATLEGHARHRARCGRPGSPPCRSRRQKAR